MSEKALKCQRREIERDSQPEPYPVGLDWESPVTRLLLPDAAPYGVLGTLLDFYSLTILGLYWIRF